MTIHVVQSLALGALGGACSSFVVSTIVISVTKARDARAKRMKTASSLRATLAGLAGHWLDTPQGYRSEAVESWAEAWLEGSEEAAYPDAQARALVDALIKVAKRLGYGPPDPDFEDFETFFLRLVSNECPGVLGALGG